MRESIISPFSAVLNDDMPPSEERVRGLETQVGHVRERLGKIEGRLDTPPKATSGFLIAGLTLVAGTLLTYLGWMGTEVVSHGKQLTSIETKVTGLVLQGQVTMTKN